MQPGKESSGRKPGCMGVTRLSARPLGLPLEVPPAPCQAFTPHQLPDSTSILRCTHVLHREKGLLQPERREKRTVSSLPAPTARPPRPPVSPPLGARVPPAPALLPPGYSSHSSGRRGSALAVPSTGNAFP